MTRMENILFVEEEKTWKPREKNAPPKEYLKYVMHSIVHTLNCKDSLSINGNGK